MSRPVLLLHLGAGALPATTPAMPPTGTWAPAVYTPPVIPGPELVIVGGIVMVNCDYSDFHLLLTEAVTEFQYINVGDAGSDADVVTVDIEQVAAGYAVAFGSKCTPISGIPYAASTSDGAVDVVGFKTFDRGGTWRYTAQQPAPGALSITLAPSPANATVDYTGIAVAPSVQVTATPSGGAAPITYAWTRVDAGGTNFIIDNTAIAAPTFSIAAGSAVYSATQQWRCTATDADGVTSQSQVDVTLARTASVGGTGVVNVTDHTISGVAYYNPDFDTSDAAIYAYGTGELSWFTDQFTAGAASGTYAGEWLTSGSAGDVEVRATQTGGNTAPAGSALGAWLNCGTTRGWSINRTTRGSANTCTLLLEFRDATTHAALDSCTINLSADVN